MLVNLSMKGLMTMRRSPLFFFPVFFIFLFIGITSPVMAGTTPIHIDTEGSGDIILENGVLANTNGAMFWNGSEWVANETAAHLYFTDLRTGERLKTHNVTSFEGTTALTHTNELYNVTRSTYSYDKPALSGGGVYRVTGSFYTITVMFTINEIVYDHKILLFSRGLGLGASQSYFDVYIEDGNGQTTAFLGDPIWYTFPNITAAAAAAMEDVSSYRNGRFPGALSKEGTYAADYFLDINGGSDQGGMSYEFRTSAMDPANALTQSLLSAFISDFSVEYTDSSGEIQDLYFVPALVSEEFIPDTPACTYSLSNTAAEFSAASASGSVTVTASAATCTWTAVSSDLWITVTAGSSGTGTGTVSYSVAANTATSIRTGTLTIAGQTYTVIQSGTVPSLDTVQKAYIGYYQRPADPGGLIWWADYLASHGAVSRPSFEAFANSDESRALYGEINSGNIASVIEAIYQALFHRAADTAGRDWYVAEFNKGAFTAATIMLNVLYGAQNDDLATLNNKVAASHLFTKTIDPELDGDSFRVTYAGDGDAVVARGFLGLVTSASSSVPTQSQTTAYIKSYIADPGDAILTQ